MLPCFHTGPKRRRVDLINHGSTVGKCVGSGRAKDNYDENDSMIELNEAQQIAVETQGDPVELIDPRTHVRYLLVRADDFDRLRKLAYDDSPWTDDEKERLAMESGSSIGWDEMSEYDNYGEARPCT